MRAAPAFLTVEHVLDVHSRVIEEFGGDLGVRDEGLLESAVAMPAAQYGGEFLHPDIASMAAAYLFHLCRNHAFVDGNKRTALASAEVFLLVNDHRLQARNTEVEALTRGVADGTVAKSEVAAFFKDRVSAAKK
jgi:death-on-curing protein